MDDLSDVLATWNDRLNRICGAVAQAEQAARIRPASAQLIRDQLYLAQERVKTLELHSVRWLTDPLRSARILSEGVPDIEQAIVAAICRAERKPEPVVGKPKPRKEKSVKPYDGPADTQCGYGGCGRKIKARGYCALHYGNMRKNGKIGIKRQGKEWCTVDGCENHVYGRNWCQNHYSNFMRTGSPLGRPRVFPPREPCFVEGCDRLTERHGMCKKHWYRVRMFGDPNKNSVNPKPGTYTICKPGQKQCIIEGCLYPQVAHGLCMLHYRRRKRKNKRNQRMIRYLSRPLRIRNNHTVEHST